MLQKHHSLSNTRLSKKVIRPFSKGELERDRPTYYKLLQFEHNKLVYREFNKLIQHAKINGEKKQKGRKRVDDK